MIEILIPQHAGWHPIEVPEGVELSTVVDHFIAGQVWPKAIVNHGRTPYFVNPRQIIAVRERTEIEVTR